MVIPGFKGMTLRELARILWQRFWDHELDDRAAQLSYYFIFSLFSFLLFLVTLIAYLPIGGTVDTVLEKVSHMMPSEAFDLIKRQADAVLHRPNPKALTGGIIVALWSASRGLNAIRVVLNLAYEVKESRPWWKVQGIALLMTIATALLTVLAVALIVLGGKFGDWLTHKVNFGGDYLQAWRYLRWPVTAGVIIWALALSYFLLPDVKQQFKLITPGSVIGSILWLLATWGFTYYVEHFADYNLAYGSIGGVAILLTWLYIGGLIFMFGGELNAIIEHASAARREPGARAPDEAAAPPSERASHTPPGAAGSASSALRSWLRFWEGLGGRSNERG
jgi:membrane protein